MSNQRCQVGLGRRRAAGPRRRGCAITCRSGTRTVSATPGPTSASPTKARDCHQRALRIREERLGPDHPQVAASLNNLGVAWSDTSVSPRRHAVLPACPPPRRFPDPRRVLRRPARVQPTVPPGGRSSSTARPALTTAQRSAVRRTGATPGGGVRPGTSTPSSGRPGRRRALGMASFNPAGEARVVLETT
jgi:hypothetical protein